MEIIREIANNFMEETNNTTEQGMIEVDWKGGKYELHLKPIHLPTFEGLNIHSTEYLKRVYYPNKTAEEIVESIQTGIFPCNIRTRFRYEGQLYLLTDTDQIDFETDVEDIVEIIKHDDNLIGRGVLE